MSKKKKRPVRHHDKARMTYTEVCGVCGRRSVDNEALNEHRRHLQHIDSGAQP